MDRFSTIRRYPHSPTLEDDTEGDFTDFLAHPVLMAAGDRLS
jgi:hypothetical protein